MKKKLFLLSLVVLSTTAFIPSSDVRGLSCGWSWEWNGCSAYVAAADCDGYTWASTQALCLAMATY